MGNLLAQVSSNPVCRMSAMSSVSLGGKRLFVIGNIFTFSSIQHRGGKKLQENTSWSSSFFPGQILNLFFAQRPAVAGEVTQFSGERTPLSPFRGQETEAETHVFAV